MPKFPSALLRLVPATKRQRLVTVGVVVVVAAGIGLGVGLSGGSPTKNASANTPTSSSTTTTPASTTICPLTDTPAPGGHVPRRPALLVKIGNEPDGARPQSGLNEADIVFDTPAEGFIMRYVAVYQCHNAPSIGPTRSVRWVDYHMIARLFDQPILAFAGGIDPNVDAVESTKWIFAANLLGDAANAGTRISSRVPPDNLYTSTSALYGLFKNRKTPPRPIFDYSSATPAGMRAISSFGINFSYGTDVVWKWQPAENDWLHTYSGSPDIDASTNQPVTASNVAVVIVNYSLGPYCESGCPGGSGDVESILKGSGTGYLLRNGHEEKITWHRPTFLGKLTFTNAAGQELDLSPGRTWVEMLTTAQAQTAGAISVNPG